jgi:hypothetical protein
MVPAWLQGPMWRESRLLRLSDPARFAFAICEGRRRMRLAPRSPRHRSPAARPGSGLFLGYVGNRQILPQLLSMVIM